MPIKDTRRTNYAGADCNGADFSYFDLHDADFRKAHLENARFYRANVCNADFSEANLNGTNLDQARAFGTKFIKAELAGATARRAALSYADFTEAKLSGADLSGAELQAGIARKADFTGANLKGIQLAAGDYQGSVLRNTDLSEAVIYRSDFSGADFSNANLLDAHIVDPQFDGAIFHHTRMPDGSLYPPEEASAALELVRLVGQVEAARTHYLAQPDDTLSEALWAAWDALLHHEAFASFPDAARVEMLVNGGQEFLAGYCKSRARSDLAHARALWRAALLDAGLEPARRKQGLRSMGGALLDSYQQTRDLQELNEAVVWQLGALTDAGLPSSDQIEVLDVLGNRLRGIGEETREVWALDHAIHLHRRAIDLTVPDTPNLPDLHDTLGLDLADRYEIGGDAADLDQAIEESRHAVNLAATRPDIDREWVADYLLNLGANLHSRFTHARTSADLDQTIEHWENALRVAPPAWPRTCLLLWQLVQSLHERYQQTHTLADLDRSIELRRRILAECRHQVLPESQPADCAKVLADLLLQRHLLQNDPKDLADSVDLGRRALEWVPARPLALKGAILASLANALRVSFRANRDGACLDEAIERAREALALLPQDHPARAKLNARLGADLLMRARSSSPASNQDSDVDAAIEEFRASVGLAPSDSEDLPEWLHNLAQALKIRFDAQGDPADLAAAVNAWRRVINLSKREDMVVVSLMSLWAAAPNQLLEMQLRDTPGVAKLVQTMDEDLAAAIRDGDEQKITDLRVTLAGVLLEFRAGAGAYQEPIEDAIRLVEEALHSPALPFPNEPAVPHDLLCRGYRRRARGLKAQNIEDSLRHGMAALELASRPEFQAACHTNLASAFLERIQGEEAENIELGIRHLEQALEVRTRERFPVQWAMLQNWLGVAYFRRVRGRHAENIERAVEHLTNALGVRTAEDFPEKRADTQEYLAKAYIERSEGEPGDNVEKAIELMRSVLEIRTRQTFPREWAMAQLNLGDVLVERRQGVPAENLRQAVECYQNAAALQADSSLWAAAHQNWANALVRLGGKEAVEDAIAHYRQALEIYTSIAFPVQHVEIQRQVGRVLADLERWEPAHDALEAALAASERLYAEAFTEAGRRSEVARAGDLYALDTWCLLRLREPGQGLERLEAGCTRLLSDALALNELNLTMLPSGHRESLRRLRQAIRALEAEMRLPSDTPARRDDRTLAQALAGARAELKDTIATIRQTCPGFMPEGLKIGEILSLIPQGAALVAPVLTRRGGAVLVVPGGTESVGLEHVLPLENFTRSDLRALLVGPADRNQLSGWLGAYFQSSADQKRWLDIIEATGRALWDRFLGPVAERLAKLEVRQVLLMPQAGLGLVPLGAAWREIDGERRYFLDEYTVTYMPSAYARRVSLARLGDAPQQQRTLLAVVNPTEDLSFAPAEGEQVARLFGPHSTVLPGTKATAEEVTEVVASYWHFACHGFYKWDDPMSSGLILAQGAPLTLAQIMGELDLNAVRLVTLSACETGLTDILQSPDEHLGLPAGFLQAGAPAVVSTLWPVNDLSTMLLMERFYYLHLKGGQPLPSALRQAQMWVRNCTAGRLANRFRREEELGLAGRPRMPIETASAAYTRFAVQDSASRPFACPFHWAAFTFNGA
jgi:CHAT domain-containing protein/uncharacterized protein YjbI with pentapeptide repeats